MEKQLYNFATIVVEQSSPVTPDERANALSFINTGTTVAFVNGIPLNPGTPGTNNGESFSIPGNRDEFFLGRIDIKFTTGIGQLLVIQKFYL